MRRIAIAATLGTKLELTELTLVQGGGLPLYGPDPIETAKQHAAAINKVIAQIRSLPSTIWHAITSWF